MKSPSITIGFSGNPGLYFDCTRRPGKKGTINSFSGQLEGATINFAALLREFGFNPNVLVPVPIEISLETTIFDFLLDRSGLPITRLHVLDAGPLAKIEDREIDGKKGVVTKEKSILQNAKKQILRSGGLWRSANGINVSLSYFAEILFRDSAGYRSFGPHHTFCADKDNFPLLESILHKTDMVILNEDEFNLLNLSLGDIHNLGVSLIIITMGEKGGYFSLCNKTNSMDPEMGQFSAVDPKTDKLFFVGAGDCFNSAFHIPMFQSKFSFRNVTFKHVLNCCEFGAKVAAIKITKEGASNVPSCEEIENF